MTDRLIVRKLERERERERNRDGGGNIFFLKKKANRENEIDGAKCDGRDKDKKIKDRWIHERRNGILHFSNFLFSFCRVFHHFYCLFFFCFFFSN